MKVLSLPASLSAILFDLDGTLYSNEPYLRFQSDSQVERLARHMGITLTQAQDKLKAAKEAHKASKGGTTSMANHFLSFGVNMETIIRWRIEEFDPRRWLSPNPALDAALASLSSRYRLGLLTNNPRLVGERSLEALGVRPRFDLVVGLDDSFESKPNRAPFDTFLRLMNVDAGQCLSVGDREDVDLRPALALGMGAVLVKGVEDVCLLPGLLGCA
jgi:FMN phosphatase YigB (HAD superfamily)